jgi:ABC-type polar amino acid transport system ATPase subunit
LKEKGHTAILVTHDLEFAQSVAEEWAIMAGGRILAKGHPKLIMADKGLMEASSLLPTDSFLLGLT